MIAFGLGGFLPVRGETESLANDEMWRFIYAVPVIVQIILLISFTFFFKEETIKFNIQSGNDEGAMATIKKVY
jgi:hypothetical protein